MDLTKYKNYVPFSKMKTRDNKPKYLVVHCSDSNYDNFESIQRFHVTAPDHLWENFGYHYAIEQGDKDGNLVAGRPEHYHGAHVKEGIINKESIGICICGKFDNKMPSEKQTETLRKLLKDLSKKYNIKPENIVPHRHFTKSKSCYGTFIPDNWARSLITGEKLVMAQNKPNKEQEMTLDDFNKKIKAALGLTLWNVYKKLMGIKE